MVETARLPDEPFVHPWAVVTGASKNIGAAVVERLAMKGLNVIAVARNLGPLQDVCAQVSVVSGRVVVPIAGDVGAATDRDRIQSVVESAISDGGLQCLINNAYFHGSTSETPLLDIPGQTWKSAFEVNVEAPLDLCRRFVRHLRLQGNGSIVNIVAGPGLQPAQGWAAYGVTTAGLWTLTRYLAEDLAPDVRVNAVCPGTVHSEDEYRAYARETLLPTVPMGRIGRPDEVANAVAYLVSQEASYTTGALLTVNGGRAW